MLDDGGTRPAMGTQRPKAMPLPGDFGQPDLYSSVTSFADFRQRLRRPFKDSPLTTWTLKFPGPLEELYHNYYFAQDLRRFQRTMYFTMAAVVGIIIINVCIAGKRTDPWWPAHNSRGRVLLLAGKGPGRAGGDVGAGPGSMHRVHHVLGPDCRDGRCHRAGGHFCAHHRDGFVDSLRPVVSRPGRRRRLHRRGRHHRRGPAACTCAASNSKSITTVRWLTADGRAPKTWAGASQQKASDSQLNPGLFLFCAYLYLQLPLPYEVAFSLGTSSADHCRSSY